MTTDATERAYYRALQRERKLRSDELAVAWRNRDAPRVAVLMALIEDIDDAIETVRPPTDLERYAAEPYLTIPVKR